MTNTSIYNIPEEVQKAIDRYYDCFDQDTGELIKDEAYMDAAYKHLEAMQNRSDDLLIWYVNDLQNKKWRLHLLEDEKERIKLQIDRAEKQIEKSEMLVSRLFEKVYRGKPLNVGTFTLNFRNSESVGEIPDAKVPEEYLAFNIKSIEIEKKALAEPGEELDESEAQKKVHVVIDEWKIDKNKVMKELKEIREEREALPEDDPKRNEKKPIEEFAFIAKKKTLNIK